VKQIVVDIVLKLVVCFSAQLKGRCTPIHYYIAFHIVIGALFFVVTGVIPVLVDVEVASRWFVDEVMVRPSATLEPCHGLANG